MENVYCVAISTLNDRFVDSSILFSQDQSRLIANRNLEIATQSLCMGLHILFSHVGKKLASGKVTTVLKRLIVPVIVRRIGAPSSPCLVDALIGGQRVESPFQYTFKMSSMPQPEKHLEAKFTCGLAQLPCVKERRRRAVLLKPGALRGLHLHPMQASGSSGSPANTHGHHHERGKNAHHGFQRRRWGASFPGLGTLLPKHRRHRLHLFEMFKADQFADVSVNHWITPLPPEAATAHMNIDKQ
jgi:hypothetical protein